MGEEIRKMMARELVLCCIIAFAARVSGDWNVNVGSNINTAPSVVNDPLLDFGALYVNDYAQHRVVECFYNGTCRDFVQKGSGGLKWPWGLDFGHHDNGLLKKSPFCTVPGSPRAVKYFRQSIFVTSYHKHTVYRYNARTGSPQGKFTHGGPTLFRPMDLEFDPFGREGLGGNLYVASQTSIYQYERHSGAFINQWSKDLRLNSVSGISFRRND